MPPLTRTRLGLHALRSLPVLLLVACNEPTAPATADALATVDEAAVPAAPTFARDVAPIVYRSCTPCHRPGQAAPFALQRYDDVLRRRDKIAEVVAQRLMPPWLPSHGEFVDDRRLTATEIATLQRWIATGAPRGNEADEPPCPEFPSTWQLRSPDLIVQAAHDIRVPADGPDRFRNFVLPVAIDAVKLVEAVEIRPGNPAVHHAVLAVDATPRARQLDAQDAEPGFAGMAMGNARPPDGNFIGWTPGKRVRRCADGMAWRLSPGEDLVLQLHLVPTGKAELVRPVIGLYFTTTAPDVVSYPLGMFADRIDLPPGAADVAVRDHFVIPVPVQVHSIYPHAHHLCRRMVAWTTPPGGERRELFRIDRWDFDWQDDYTFRTPLALPAGTRIEFEYRYDNSDGNPANPSRPPRHVRLGDESTDEMGNLTLHVTTADLDARRRLGEAAIRRDLEKRATDTARQLELAGLLRETGRVDEALAVIGQVRAREPANAEALCTLGTCLAAAGRRDEAERAYAESLRLDDGQNIARNQLANLLLQTGRAPAATPLYEEAVRREPRNPSLHNNLATAYLACNVLDRAEQHYRVTVSLDQTFFQAWFNLGRVLAATGRQQEARDALLRAQALRPADERVQQALQQLGR